ncbi:MAG TPA: nucleotide sugar dehydrogenase [Actinomycetota bacterium]|nr:nucleotide sugar dehydrogenase [Actinomycetota bacterium]
MKGTARLRRRILSRDAEIAVLGQGYVGLSLACAAAEAGFHVTGIDPYRERTDALRQGTLAVPGVSETAYRAGFESGRLEFALAADAIESSDVIVVCVPTPVQDHSPDLSHIEAACKEVALRLRPGAMVILESTTYPGTTEEIVRPILESSALSAEHDFLLAYSPERIDPGNIAFDFRDVPRVVGGLTAEAAGAAALFYGQLVDQVVPVASCRSAELAKLLENAFRHVNIALVNEMAMLCHEMGIDAWEVIRAAASKPFGFMSFQPGPGVGGHCIPLDSTYLAWQIRRDAGHQFRILEQAEDINSQMPSYVVSRIVETLNDAGKSVRGAGILVLGVAYKADVGDIRESPALRIMQGLARRGARVSWSDPHVAEIPSAGMPALTRCELSLRALDAADIVALLTPHSAFDLAWIGQHASLVFDARNAFGANSPPTVVAL